MATTSLAATTADVMALCDVVRQTAYELRRYLGHGHIEKIYCNGLAHRLRKLGIRVEQKIPVTVYDEDGTSLGDLEVDLLVNGILIIELKACSALVSAHVAQTLGYLRATRIEHALLINFGAARFEIKKYVLAPLEADEDQPQKSTNGTKG